MEFPLDTPPAFPPDTIEAGIRPLVDAMNATRWALSQFSCEGHPPHQGMVRLPYVDFLMPERCAKAVSYTLLMRQYESPFLNFTWEALGVFIMPTKNSPVLAWRITPDPGMAKRWSRRRMDADLRVLVNLLPPIVAQAGESGSIAFLGLKD